MRILGIDTGFAIVGWSIIERDPKKGISLVGAGSITTSAGLDISIRLKDIFIDMTQIIETYKPDHMAIESIFYSKNQKTVIDVAQARGVLILAGSLQNLLVYNYTPLQVKTAVTGYGKADKKQVQEMVTRIFKLDKVPSPDDVADAMAIGYCHASVKL